MKKFMLGLVLGLGALLFGVSPFVGAVNTDNFTITSYKVDMHLGRDTENHSTLHTVETITAKFPDFDQNHGLEKVFVKDYDGHQTNFRLVSATDENGNPYNYSWNDDALRIGDADSYVHGEKTYVITYTQRDVTKFYADTNKDEFYWDAIGVEWRVPIQKAEVSLAIDGSIKGFSSTAYCYIGKNTSNERCDVVADSEGRQEQSGEQTPLVYRASAEDIGRSQGLTVAVGFMPGTFAVYEPTLLERIIGYWLVVQGALVAVGAVAIGWIIKRWNQLIGRDKEMGTIVPEYLPPKDASVTTTARVGGYIGSVMTAQLLDLAVRHYIRIYEVKAKSFFRPAEYEIEIIKDISDLRWEEKELLTDTFGNKPTTVGQRLNLKELTNSTEYYKRTMNNDGDLDKLVRGEYGLKEESPEMKQWSHRFALGFLVAGVLTLSPILILVALIAFIVSYSYRTTDKGLALKRYAEGLKMYIKVAEQERLRMLQSPEGAKKVASVTAGSIDTAQLVKLYEKVLPYAVLFGQEKQWNQQLGSYYETAGTQPDWYVGQTAFNAGAFSSAMGGLSSAANSASSYSSSSGGSGGGGSAGGGGGGGGGGGW